MFYPRILIAFFAAGRPQSQSLLVATAKNENAVGPLPTPEKALVKYEVCLSPGCLADGAQSTLEMLQALAPPDVVVKAGTCISRCGNGPVVVNSSSTLKNTATHRKVSGSKILELLSVSDEEIALELVEGYNLVLDGDLALSKKDFNTAAELYEKAIGIAFRPAMELQSARDRMLPEARTTRAPVGLDWLVRARRNEAIARLEVGDVEAAMLSAQAACNLSRNTSVDSFIVLAEIYRRKGDDGAELETLKTMFAMPVDESKLDFQKQNKRRELGFRMAKLEKNTRK